MYTVQAKIDGKDVTITTDAKTEREARHHLERAAGNAIDWSTFAKPGAKPFKIEKPKAKEKSDEVHL